MNETSGFHFRKWTLFGFCLIGILVTLIVIIVACKAVDDAKPTDKTIKPEDWNAAQKVAKGVIIAVGVIGMLFHGLGLFGAYKENYCLTLTFAILMTLATLGSIGSATKQSAGWGSFVVDLLVTVLAYVFARDLKNIQRGVPGHSYTA